MSSISDRRDLLTKVRFPAQVLPATMVATNLANYLLSLPLLLALGFVSGVNPTWHALLFLPIVLLQTLFLLGLTYLLSALNVAFRDLQHLLGNIMTLWFFATPVLWDSTRIKAEFLGVSVRRLVIYCNPMGAITVAYQDVFYKHQLPNWRPLATVAALSFVMLIVASAIFERRREEFAELV